MEEKQSGESLEWLFHPRSIAAVGVSDRKAHLRELFMDSQKAMGYEGKLYAINITGEQVSDFPTYKRLADVPGPVDHVIITVPAARIREVLNDCTAKGVRSVHAFTSGFGESDNPEGRILQNELEMWIKEQPFRFIGPNCMGLYCPETGLAFRPDLIRESGTIGYVSQSGGMAITGIFMAGAKELRFSKAVSYGNEAGLRCAELLRYLAEDPATEVVWAYIEGTQDGEELIDAMTEVYQHKPLLVLKGGSTETGGRAVASHTGAMAGSSAIWPNAIQQTGAILVKSLEEIVDTTMALQWLPSQAGKRLGIACISGGLSVNYTDQAIRAGFEVPAFSKDLVKHLKETIDLPGTSLNNPLDFAAGFFQFQDFPRLFGAIGQSKEIDAMIMVVALEYIPVLESRSKYPDLEKIMISVFKACQNEMDRPFLVVMPPVLYDEFRLEFEREFLKANIPTYPSMRRALIALDNWKKYHNRRQSLA
ncbi:MAG: CoA-binding protein [Deltaproteobacteria bacterium]|nr:CoA-binding protein [Deltaproteobacteria bacterium]MBW1849641.1 CoA-binding protein [Deltaproteobacteria bacterium]MBW1984877.1 CoA-binding protein [Deltaproteobacteria bacterium]